MAAGLAQCHPTCLACHQRAGAVPLELSRCHQRYLSSSPLRLSLCAATSSASARHSCPRSCQEQPELSDFCCCFQDETVHAARGRARSQRPSEVIAAPVNSSCMQAGLSSHFVFQGRSLSEEVLCHVLCVTEQRVLACIKLYFVQPQGLGPGLFCGVLISLGIFGTAREIPSSNFFTTREYLLKKNGFRQNKQPGIKSAWLSLNAEEP